VANSSASCLLLGVFLLSLLFHNEERGQMLLHSGIFFESYDVATQKNVLYVIIAVRNSNAGEIFNPPVCVRIVV
jgi:hypothetical protein